MKSTATKSILSAFLLAAAVAPALSQTTESPSGNDVKLLKEQVASQQKQIEELRSALEEQKRVLERALQPAQRALVTPAAKPPSTAGEQSSTEIASTVPVIPKDMAKVESASAPLAAAPLGASVVTPPQEQPETSPLQLRVGSAYITPIGFLDFTGVYRSRTEGSGIGTNFGSVPYGSNLYQDKLSEFRFSMQNSRIGFRVDASVKGAHVIGYMESDFLGNNPTNVAVSSNSNTLRSRLYWVDVAKKHWEVLGGQTWSLITPGRTGISPLPGNLFFTQDIDVNYQAGMVWGRIPEFRFVWHQGSKAAFAFALDSPEQYIGGSAGGSLVTFQPALSAAPIAPSLTNPNPPANPNPYPGGELNNGTTTLNVPNVSPDLIAKLAFDPSSKFHFEFGGILREFKLWNPPSNSEYPTVTHTATGGGGFVNLNFELFKGFRLVTNNYWSDGGGRYIFGQAPDLIAHADGSPSLVHSGSTVSGFEYTHANTIIYSYYGGIYIDRNFAIVPVTTTSGTPPVTTTKLTPFGYGYTGSPTGQNRSIQEPTVGFAQTFWKDPKYGALTFMAQYGYFTRSPWYIAAGQPKNAHMNEVFINLRYTLPGSAPAIK